jgi:two-component system copper resistance phosphate regulon response regulator CusR
MLTEQAYDALVLDVLLPGKGGLEVCREIRDGGSAIPILMLTALDAVDKRIAGLDAGADDYLTKPFDFGELLARLRAVTRRQHVETDEVTVGELVIDTAKHSVRRGQRPITLTAKEFEMLAYLAKKAGRVVSRNELIEQVWKDSASSYSNIIDVYAGRLRRKIDLPGEAPMLTTVRSAGLLLDVPATKQKKSVIPSGNEGSTSKRDGN